MTLLKDTAGTTAGVTFSTVVVKGGLDHGVTATGRHNERRPLSTIVTVEQLASVLAKDLAGNNLRVYSTEGGATLLSNPLTADSNGRISGFVEAPDFDLYVTPIGGGAYTQKVRTSPPGVFHVNSYGAKCYPDNNAIGTLEAQDGFNAAYNAALASRGWGSIVESAAGTYLVGGSIVPQDNILCRGAGGLGTVLYLKSGVNAPIIDSTSLVGGRYPLQGLGFRAQNYASHSKAVTAAAATDIFTATAHGLTAGMKVQFSGNVGGAGLFAWFPYYVIAANLTANTFQVSATLGGSSVNLTTNLTAGSVKALFPLVKLMSYASWYRDLFFQIFPGDALEMTSQSGLGGAGDTNTFQDVSVAGVNGVSRFAFFMNNSAAAHIYGGLTVSVDVGAYLYEDIWQAGNTSQIHGYHFEQVDRFCIYLAGAHGVGVHDNYVFEAPIGLDKTTANNRITDNTLVECPIHDVGRDNVTTPNKGRSRLRIEGVPHSELLPASYIRDSDFSYRSVGAWTAVGGATLTKIDNGILRHYDRTGRLPLGITGAANKGASQVITGLTAGDTFEVGVHWYSGPSGGVQARMRLKLIDNIGAGTLWDSGVVSRYGVVGDTEWVDETLLTVFQVPAGITDVRMEATTPDAGALFLSRAIWRKSAVANGGFEGAYAAGVAPNWTVTAGAGTASEETTSPLGGTSSQKLTVAAGQALTLGQVVVPDEDSFYLMRARVRVNSGGFGRAQIGWGNLALTDVDAQGVSRVSGRFNGQEEGLSVVFRPSTGTRVLIGLTTDPAEAAEAVFDDLVLFPLKDTIGPLVYVSDEIDLTAASKNYIVAMPQNRDLRVRRVHFQYTVAATAVGPSIRVGIVGNATYYATVGPGVNPQAVGDVIRSSGYPTSPLSHTEVRTGVPVIVTHSGAVANSGKGYIVVEAE